MKRVRKKIAFSLVIISLFTMCNFYASAQQPESIYEENVGQINLRNTTFQSSNQKLSVEVDDSNIFTRYFGNKEKARIDALLADYPQLEEAALQKMNQGEDICVIAFTEAPIRIYEDHMERVQKKEKPSLFAKILTAIFPTAQAAQTASGPTAYEAEGNFALFTMISKQNSGEYIASSIATWERGSWIGGAKYPATGYDYLLQSVPNNFARKTHSFSCFYNTSGNPELTDNAYEGVEGSDYTITNGGNTYLKVKLKDDPFGFSRLSMCMLGTTQISSSYSSSRTINSYYVHTWKDMDINVSISVNTSREAALNITPTISEKSWQIYSYVTFSF